MAEHILSFPYISINLPDTQTNPSLIQTSRHKCRLGITTYHLWKPIHPSLQFSHHPYSPRFVKLTEGHRIYQSIFPTHKHVNPSPTHISRQKCRLGITTYQHWKTVPVSLQIIHHPYSPRFVKFTEGHRIYHRTTFPYTPTNFPPQKQTDKNVGWV